MRTIKFFILISVFISAVVFFSCDDAGISTNDTFELSTWGTQDSTLFDNAIILDTVKFLMKDIKMNVSHTNDSNNFKTGPIVVYIKTGGITSLGNAELPVGSYDKIKFEIHKLTSTETPPDPEFADSLLYSVVVKGRWQDSSGTYPFIFKTDANAHQILAFPDSLVIATGVIQNVTILAKPYMWFYDNSTGKWLSPFDEGNRQIINNNIKNNVNSNLRAFRDNDRNGQPD